MRSVRHFSRALHQVSVCGLITSARHSQVQSPNMRTSQHIVAASVRVVHICSSKSWLTRANATSSRNDLQTANTLIPRNQSCSRYATIDDFSCTETQADGSNSNGIPKTFFFSRCEMNKQNNNKNFGPTSPGVARDSFFSFYFIYFIYLLIQLIQ